MKNKNKNKNEKKRKLSTRILKQKRRKKSIQ